jgi:hypothetical protein
MSLVADLDVFYLEHRRCGELESDVSEDSLMSTLGWAVRAAVLTRLVTVARVGMTDLDGGAVSH